MNGADETIIAEATDWHLASARDDMDWDGFTRWLEADVRHRTAYDEIVLADAALAEHGAMAAMQPAAANDDTIGYADDEAVAAPDSIAWHRWGGLAIAASLALVLALPWIGPGGPTTYATEAASRAIALQDGSQIVLAPHSRLEIADGERRIALSGAAWFDISHRPSRNLAITAGDLELRDIGTRFDVQETGGQVRVAVAEGHVRVASAAFDRPIDLSGGRGLTYDPRGGAVTVRDVRSEDAGAWRSGRLTYDAAPLVLVAADLARYTGVQVVVDKTLQDRRFSGTLIVGNGEAALRDLAQLMGLGLVGSNGAYRVTAQPG